MEKALEKLFAALDEIVSDDRPYKEKADLIKKYAAKDEQDSTNLAEFLAWFGMDEGEEVE